MPAGYHAPGQMAFCPPWLERFERPANFPGRRDLRLDQGKRI